MAYLPILSVRGISYCSIKPQNGGGRVLTARLFYNLQNGVPKQLSVRSDLTAFLFDLQQFPVPFSSGTISCHQMRSHCFHPLPGTIVYLPSMSSFVHW